MSVLTGFHCSLYDDIVTNYCHISIHCANDGSLVEVLEKCLFYFQDSCSGWSVHAFAISAGPTGSILDRTDCIIYHKKFLV